MKKLSEMFENSKCIKIMWDLLHKELPNFLPEVCSASIEIIQYIFQCWRQINYLSQTHHGSVLRTRIFVQCSSFR